MIRFSDYRQMPYDKRATLTELDTTRACTFGMTDMSSLFADCIRLKKLDLSTFDTSSVRSMCNMFRGCCSLSQVDLSSFDTSHTTTMMQMFKNCVSLTTLDLSRFDFSRILNLRDMFAGCTKLREVILSDTVMGVRWQVRTGRTTHRFVSTYGGAHTPSQADYMRTLATEATDELEWISFKEASTEQRCRYLGLEEGATKLTIVPRTHRP